MVTKKDKKELYILLQEKNRDWTEWYSDYRDALRGLAIRFNFEVTIKED